MKVVSYGGESGGHGGEFEGGEEEGDANGEENEPEHGAFLRRRFRMLWTGRRLHGLLEGGNNALQVPAYEGL